MADSDASGGNRALAWKQPQSNWTFFQGRPTSLPLDSVDILQVAFDVYVLLFRQIRNK